MDEREETDPFLRQMFARMSPGAKYLFTPYQLDEIKRAFSARSFGAHAVDLRFSVRFFRTSYYVVLLLGRERRLRARQHRKLLGTALLLFLLMLLGYAVLSAWTG
jgi:hypothetical protein